jgi:hypothetical protein
MQPDPHDLQADPHDLQAVVTSDTEVFTDIEVAATLRQHQESWLANKVYLFVLSHIKLHIFIRLPGIVVAKRWNPAEKLEANTSANESVANFFDTRHQRNNKSKC